MPDKIRLVPIAAILQIFAAPHLALAQALDAFLDRLLSIHWRRKEAAIADRLRR
jgi:hypothetical protein